MHPLIAPALQALNPSVSTAPAVVLAMSRRNVLGSGLGLGLIVAVGGWLPIAARAAAPAVSTDGSIAAGPLAPNAFVRVGTDNLVTVVCKHCDMGQGNTTGLATMVADELDADWALVRTEYAPADDKLYGNAAFGGLQGTGGSSAIASSYEQMRKAGATARAMLVAAAAEAWGVPAAQIQASNSVLSHGSGKHATYGEMALAASKQQPPADPTLKTPAQFTLIGKEGATPRVDSVSKCHGTAVYTIDVKLPGLLTAVIAWPPSFGAKLVSFDAAAAKQVRGVTDVVQVPEGVAVVARGTWAALQGRRALTLVWDESESAKLDSEATLAHYRELATTPGASFGKPGSDASATAVVKTVEAVYEFPFLAHAPMEPMNCVAWLHEGRLETWAGHQFQAMDHKLAADAAGLPLDKVKLNTLVAGGSFGRRANAASDFTVAAVHVAKAIDGRAPVRLQYTREDDNSGGFYRPLTVHAVKAGIDAQGRIAQWQHTIVAQSIVAGTPFAAGAIKDGVDATSVEGVHPTQYALPMLSGSLHSPVLAVAPLWWRSVGNTHTAYVMETMMDELAAAAGTDALAFRLALLQDNPRAANVLKLAAAKANWGRPMAAGTAQGLALHHSFATFVAQVAEVRMRDGKVVVERVVCAVDCGVAVNPDVIRAQMEGGIGFALGALYYSEVGIKQGRAVDRNFDTYKSLRIHEMPKVEVHIVDSTEKPTGVGEPGVPPLAPAVANALAKLGVARVRRLPLARAGLVAA